MLKWFTGNGEPTNLIKIIQTAKDYVKKNGKVYVGTTLNYLFNDAHATNIRKLSQIHANNTGRRRKGPVLDRPNLPNS